jgi:internalin A
MAERSSEHDNLSSPEGRIRAARQNQASSLDLSRFGLTALPAALCELTQLHSLDLSRNNLITLPASVANLTQLWALNLSSNRLTTLPSGLKRLNQLDILCVHDNPGLSLPTEILGPSWENIKLGSANPVKPFRLLDYYFSSREHSRPLNEAKMILLGRGGVGKTSLVERIVHGTFDSQQKKTEGIAITPWAVHINSDQIRLNIWDFGGQEIMHATHQFFFTKRSLYLLVLNAREGEQDANIEYWLRLTESFGGNSPVIVVINKITDNPFDLNRRGLQQKFPGVRDFIQTDCQSNTGISELLNAIKREVDRLPNLRDAFPSSWFSLKDSLATMKENFITYPEYQSLCAHGGIEEKTSQDTLVSFLHDLGIVVNFRDEPRLADTHVLNPQWVTL